MADSLFLNGCTMSSSYCGTPYIIFGVGIGYLIPRFLKLIQIIIKTEQEMRVNVSVILFLGHSYIRYLYLATKDLMCGVMTDI